MTLSSIMTTEVIRVGTDEPLFSIQQLLQRKGFHHVLVEDNGALVGVISDRDVLRTVSPFLDTVIEQQRDVNTLHLKARQLMSRDPVTATPETTVNEAIALFLEHGFSCLPVVSDDGSLRGLVTTRDLLRHVALQMAE